MEVLFKQGTLSGNCLDFVRGKAGPCPRERVDRPPTAEVPGTEVNPWQFSAFLPPYPSRAGTQLGKGILLIIDEGRG